MATFAVLDKSIVVNVIVADSKEIAEEATNATCIEYTEENPAGIGWTRRDNEWIAPVVETVIDEAELLPEGN
jgi:hypothetical protein